MQSRYIDIHAHLNFAAYDADRDEVIKRCEDASVAVINVGTQIDTSRGAIELTERHEHMWAIVGLHPIHTSRSFHDHNELGEGGAEFTSRGEMFDKEAYRKLLAHPKVVGLGECGLDYFRLEEGTKDLQKKNFIEQIELANEVSKPLMLHIRNAYADAYEVLKAHSKVPGNLHFFAGTIDETRPFLDLGYTFSFTGAITFAKNYVDVIKFLPLDRIMSETDCPYVAPKIYRGKRNEPAHVREVVKKIAEIKELSTEMVEQALVANARRVFRL
jgi:TatD DNase family protein